MTQGKDTNRDTRNGGITHNLQDMRFDKIVNLTTYYIFYFVRIKYMPGANYGAYSCR